MKVLYIAYWGLLEPLGQSLILPAVKLIGRRGVHITLITFEKAHDLNAGGDLKSLKRDLARDNVFWRPLRYHKSPTIPATLFDLVHGIVAGLGQGRHDVIHGRTFIGGLIGALVHLITGRPFVFHGEGFWPDQQVEGGFWSNESTVYRVCKVIERWMGRSADGLILLSHQSKALIKTWLNGKAGNTPTIVVPSCVDLDKFTVKNETDNSNEKRLIYLGSLGGRYPVEPLGWLLTGVLDYDEGWHLDIYSQSDHRRIRETLHSAASPENKFTISRIPHSMIPDRLRRSSAGLFFLESGIGAMTCSPTKIGEYLASGIPVVTSSGAGDTDEIVRKHGVGVILDEITPEACRVAARELIDLLRDPDLAQRCRRAAEEHYSLAGSVDDQIRLYDKVCKRKYLRL